MEIDLKYYLFDVPVIPKLGIVKLKFEDKKEDDKMTKEEVRKELNEARKLQKEATRKVNEALCHAAGQLDRANNESFETGHKIGYDKGLNDCWEMVWNVFEYVPAIRAEIFGVSPANFGQILTNFTPQQALEKIRAWEEKKTEEERKKQEEAEKIQIGDVVEVTDKLSNRRRGIFLKGDDTTFALLTESTYTSNLTEVGFYASDWTIKKTGEHVDILRVLK